MCPGHLRTCLASMPDQFTGYLGAKAPPAQRERACRVKRHIPEFLVKPSFPELAPNWPRFDAAAGVLECARAFPIRSREKRKLRNTKVCPTSASPRRDQP